jgi:[acyl-carrier-protein] S-malonyltransferase
VTSYPGNEVVATVADRTITVVDVADRIAAVRRGPAGTKLPLAGTQEDVRLRRWMAQLLITELLVLHEAASARLLVHLDDCVTGDTIQRHASSPVTSNGADTVAAVQIMAAATALFEHVTGEVTVTEAEVRGYYDANPDLYSRPELRRVRHVLLDTEANARRVTEAVAAGIALEDLAAQRSLDHGSRTRGGDLGWIGRGEMVGPFEETVFASYPGSLARPFRTQFGWHVLRVESVSPAHHVAFHAARGAIEAELLAAARGLVFDRWLEGRRQALVCVNPSYAHPGDPSLPDSVHRH